jgi:hypothetical protein
MTIEDALASATADLLRERQHIEDRLIRRPVAEREYEIYCGIGARQAYLEVLSCEARDMMEHAS